MDATLAKINMYNGKRSARRLIADPFTRVRNITKKALRLFRTRESLFFYGKHKGARQPNNSLTASKTDFFPRL